MLCLSGFELYSRWVPLSSMDVITSRVEYRSSVFIKTVFEVTFSFSNIL